MGYRRYDLDVYVSVVRGMICRWRLHTSTIWPATMVSLTCRSNCEIYCISALVVVIVVLLVVVVVIK